MTTGHTQPEPIRDDEDGRCGFCKLDRHALCRQHRSIDCRCECRR